MMPEATHDRALRGPHWLWYIVGLALVIVPPAGALGGLLLSIIALNKQTTVFTAPGEQVVTVESPATYTIWNEVTSRRDGRTFVNEVVEAPDVTITVTDAATNQALPTETHTGTWVEFSNTRRRSLANVEITQPGDYVVDVASIDDEEFVIAVSPAVDEAAASVFGNFLAPLIGAAVAFVLGVAILIVTFLRRLAANERRKDAEYAEIAAGF